MTVSDFMVFGACAYHVKTRWVVTSNIMNMNKALCKGRVTAYLTVTHTSEVLTSSNVKLHYANNFCVHCFGHHGY